MPIYIILKLLEYILVTQNKYLLTWYSIEIKWAFRKPFAQILWILYDRRMTKECYFVTKIVLTYCEKIFEIQG